MLQADGVVSLLGDVLPGDVAGAYLYGSAVVGGLKPCSDVDILAVVRRRTSAPERRAIVDGLMEITGPFPPVGEQRPVELTVVVESDVRPWRYPPTMEMQYGEWLRSEFVDGRVPSRRPNPDLAVLITTVLLANGRLFGPPADALLDPVPQSDLHRAMVDCIPDFLNDLDSDTCNGVLTLARIWTTLETGAIEPKDAAAGWVLERLPHEHRAPLAYARAVYLGADPPADTRAGDVHAHAAYVIGEITRLAR